MIDLVGGALGQQQGEGPRVRRKCAVVNERTMRPGKPTSERGAAQRRRAMGGFRGGAQAFRGGA